MRRLTPKILLVASLVLLDFFLVHDIHSKKSQPQVLGAVTLKTIPPQAEAAVKVNQKNEVKIAQVGKIIKITLTPTPTLQTSSPAPTQTPSEPSQSQVDTNEVQKFILGKINEYRATFGLPGVSANSETCSFAKTRAEEIKSAFNHDGFRQRIDSKNLPYTSYSMVTENIAMTSDYKNVVDMWINSTGHAENMRKDTPFVCVEQNISHFAYEGWKP